MSKDRSADATKPRRLGRGLSSLINKPVEVAPPHATQSIDNKKVTPDNPNINHTSTPVSVGSPSRVILDLAPSQIVPSPFQPRRVFDEAALDELAASIRAAGVVQPIVVRCLTAGGGKADADGSGGGSDAAGDRYELVAGERRWRAAGRAGLTTIPAVLADLPDDQAASWSLIENLQREDLRPLERAEALKALCERFGMTQAQAASRVGLDRTSVTNLIRLTELSGDSRGLLEDGSLTLGHGKALLSLPDTDQRDRLAKQCKEEGWSVRRLEDEVSKLLSIQDDPGAAPKKVGGLTTDHSREVSDQEAAQRELVKTLSTHFGTRVRLRTDRTGKRGEIAFQFYSLDHFDGLMSKMGVDLS